METTEEEFDDWWDKAVLASKRGELPTWSMEEIDKHPLFCSDIKEDISDNPGLLAIQDLIYGQDETPESIATLFKNNGNDAMQTKQYKHAVRFYTTGIEQNCSDAKLQSVLYSNRAQGHMQLQMYPECVKDCEKALTIDPKNVKAAFRGAVASEKIELPAQGLKLAIMGLAAEPDNQHLLEITERLRASVKAIEAARISSTEASDNVLKTRGVMVGKSHYQYPGDMGTVDIKDEVLTFPMLFLYDEAHMSDWVTGATELDTLADHFDNMFQTKPDWATGDLYNEAAGMLFFIEVYADHQGDNTVCFKVSRNDELGELLKGTHLCGFPIVHVIPKSSKAALTRFIDENTVVQRRT